MSRVLLTGGPGFFSRLANVRFMSAAREVGSTGETPALLPEEPATMDVRGGQTSRGLSNVPASLDHHADSLDAVAGSEFVDDRIRLRE